MQKVLIIEDSRYQRKTIRAKLSSLNVSLFDCDNAAEALKIIRDELIDIVITDLHMPDMDGVSLSKEIRLIRPDAIIIALSGDVDGALAQYGEDGEIDHFINKPLKAADLAQVLERFLD